MENKHTRFQNLLLSYSRESSPQKRQTIEREIWESYGAKRVVFVLDMSGFSLLTRKYGIVHYLSMIRRMQITVEPIIESQRGKIVKFEADNCFAIFPDSLSAVNAGIAIQLAFKAANLVASDDLDIHVSCGIDYGNILIVDDEDMFGDAVNRACKLGEDVAAAGEILITREAFERIPPQAGIAAREIFVSVSGVSMPAYAVAYAA